MATCKWGDCEIRDINNEYGCPIWKDLEKMKIQNPNMGTTLFNAHFWVFEWIKANWNAFIKEKRKNKKKKYGTCIYYLQRQILFPVSEALTLGSANMKKKIRKLKMSLDGDV